MKKILSWIAFILGIVLVVCGWCLWGQQKPTEVFVLNIVVSVVMYVLIFSDLLISWYQPEDKSARRIGNMGLKWGVVFFYVLFAVAIIVLSDVYGLTFYKQLFLHGITVVLLIIGFAFVVHGASNIGQVHEQQVADRLGLEVMRREAKNLYNDALDKGNVPAELTSRISKLIEELRFVSPSGSLDAADLEKRFADTAARARVMISSYTANGEDLAAELSKLERILKDRKSVYSN